MFLTLSQLREYVPKPSIMRAVFPGDGREYGYVLPDLKKASQAAGRPIRSLEDRGAIIFLDYCFATKCCQRFLPFWIRRGMKTLPDEEGAIAKELILFHAQKTNPSTKVYFESK